MWLASVSLTNKRGRKVCTPSWRIMQWHHAFALLDEATHGIGHPEHFRKFRMQITLCKHVPLREDEIAVLPPGWMETRGDSLAGGPVEALDSVGLPTGLVSVRPCENPGKKMLVTARGFSDDDEAWLPVECGRCASCRAREELFVAAGH